MRFLRSFFIIMHTVFFLVIGGLMVSLSLNFFPSEGIANFVNFIYTAAIFKMITGFLGSLVILAGLLSAHISLSRVQAEKTIAFENPEGQVTVSLSAVEDYIKKSVHHIPEIKELRSNITANKKGINIICRATLFAESNIPETTERLQNIIKKRMNEMLGVEEPINIRIHVIKITSKGKKLGPANIHSAEYDETSQRMPLGLGE